MNFDFDTISAEAKSKLLHSTIVPRPIAWVTSHNGAGHRNMAPFSFFNVFGTDPGIVGFSIAPNPDGRIKDTVLNVRATRDFVVHLVSFANREAMNATAFEAEPDVDEIDFAGLTAIPSTKVSAPRIAECAVAMECVLHSEIDLGNNRSVVLGQVVVMHIDDEMMENPTRFYVATPQLDLIGRMHGRGWYTRTTDLFLMERHATAPAPLKPKGSSTV